MTRVLATHAVDGEEKLKMTFSDLEPGDIFEAFGLTFQKSRSVILTLELPGANAINIHTGRPAFFGATVPVLLLRRGELELFDRHMRRPDLTGQASA